MSRRVRRHPYFRSQLGVTVRWLAAYRSKGEIARLRSVLRTITLRLASFPALGQELEEYAGRSIRVIRLGRLPYLLWYTFDPADRDAPVWLLFLMHEKQDRGRFDPSLVH